MKHGGVEEAMKNNRQNGRQSSNETNSFDSELTEGLYRQDKFQCFCLAYCGCVSLEKMGGGGHGPPGPHGSDAYEWFIDS